MALKLMYITNKPQIAKMAENAGVDRIFVDLEYIGKAQRQKGMNTVQSHHTLDDVRCIKECITSAQLLVRINPVHESSALYCCSKDEIEGVIENGADIIMLPYFKTVEEVKKFVQYVNGRVRTILLVETPEAVKSIDEILALDGIDEIFIGLNDLSLGLKKKFMFELLSDGTVETLCFKFKQKGIPYGFGGIASIGKGLLPSEYIIKEHYRLGSTSAILSRSFCNTNVIQNFELIKYTFTNGVLNIRELERECSGHRDYFIRNKQEVKEKVQAICEELK